MLLFWETLLSDKSFLDCLLIDLNFHPFVLTLVFPLVMGHRGTCCLAYTNHLHGNKLLKGADKAVLA